MNIWIDGRIVPADQARVAVTDRSLEHGLGLFETMRADRGGRVPLLGRHLRRIQNSAALLGLPIDGVDWPTASDIAGYWAESGFADECVIRLTLSAGGPESDTSSVWMIARTMPAAIEPGDHVRILGRFRLDPDDELLRHKTLNHWHRRRLMEQCRLRGGFESIGRTDDGRIWEAIWANLFVVRDSSLWTPSLEGPILPGIMRGVVLERAKELGIEVVEGELDNLRGEELFLTNAVRGILRVTHCDDRHMPDRSPVTDALRDDLKTWLAREDRQ